MEDVDDRKDIENHAKMFGYIPNRFSKAYLDDRLRRIDALISKSPERRLRQEKIDILNRLLEMKSKAKAQKKLSLNRKGPRLLEKLRMSKTNLPFDVEMSSRYDENRRNHFYRGMTKVEYHKFFDHLFFKLKEFKRKNHSINR